MQQINLYVPELRPRRDWLDARNTAIALAAVVAIIVVGQIALALRAANLEDRVTARQETVAQVRTRVEELRKHAQLAGNQSLDRQIEQLRGAITNRERVEEIIAGQNLGNAQGFAASLTSLARQSAPAFALERFTLSDGGQFVQMHGLTRNAEAIPLYLQRLKEQPGFRQARFGLFSLSSERDKKGALEFSLGYTSVYDPQETGTDK